MKIKSLIITITLLFSFIIHARTETACRVSAFIADRDRGGLNARGGARARFSESVRSNASPEPVSIRLRRRLNGGRQADCDK